MKIYGNYTEHELNEWQTIPFVESVLTSSVFGAWLLRRDENKAKQEHSFDGMTNGEVIQTLFPKIKVKPFAGMKNLVRVIFDETEDNAFEKDWWYALYKGGEQE